MTEGAVVKVETGEITEVRPFSAVDYLKTLGPEALQQQKELAAAYDKAVDALIGPNDVQQERDKNGKVRTFKKKSAWRKLARHFNISVEITKVEYGLRDGTYFYATVTARAKAPWGQVYEDVGACCTDEAVGRRVITTADAIATASTRASNRAISNLIAMGEVSAEEMTKGPQKAQPLSEMPAAIAEDVELTEPLEPKALNDLLLLVASAGIKKAEYPRWYERVTGHEYDGWTREGDAAAIRAECSKLLAKKGAKA